ncbi:unnamed protein product [Clonostachys solani]|uniref:Uncharacterized protein n=1 Tax=Clonostachys solani TaxID=160281 RepID=A0A9P0ERH1_9HYPO|nr:unnamed protein product [Clonostachys solani]
MPVTIRPQPETVGANTDRVVSSSQELLAITSRAWTLESSVPSPGLQTNKRPGPEDRPVLRTSFEDIRLDPFGNGASAQGLVPYGNGFVEGVIRAFEQDLHLVLRPDDVWLAILVQFSFYVNGNAEELRDIFVSHEGKKTLAINLMPASLENINFEVMSDNTTTANDRTVSALVLMATMKSYFEYVVMFGCGFPSVTLEGEREDWEELAARIQRFSKYGSEPAEWCIYLSKVAEKMVASFDRPDDQDIKDFWMQACHSAGASGSGGVTTLSGWLTAFCFWSEEGRPIHAYSDQDLVNIPMGQGVDRKRLVLDGVSFPVISRGSIPNAVSDVPIKLEDMGSGKTYHTTVVAGLVAMQRVQGESESQITRVQPRSGWWMLLDSMEYYMDDDIC